MARKEDFEPAGASGVLKGVSAALATLVKAHVDIVVAAPVDPRETDQAMRTVALIARGALSLHQLRAAEDKADDRSLERAAKRAFAAVRTLHFTAEEDETDMNERDPRLDTPEGMAEIREEARQCVAGVVERLELKRADRPCDGGGVGAGIIRPAEKLAGERPPTPTPA